MIHTNRLFVVMILPAAVAFADEPEVSKEEIQHLIVDLVSPNPAPVRKGSRAIYPEGYDRNAQAKISTAFHKLFQLGPRAFPYLFDHLDDKRYSLTGQGMEADENKSVGQLCFDIIYCHLQPYGRFAKSRSNMSRLQVPSYFQHFKLSDPAGAREWWKTHQDKSLQELQNEVLEWIVTEEDKDPEKYIKAERDSKRKLLEKLRAADAPFKPSWIFPR
jgi:hypothetical protein